LEHELQGQIKIKIASKADWHVFNEIFADGDYDSPLFDAFREKETKAPLVVLDLGANVGFFALRVLTLRHRLSPNCALRIMCIEGCEQTFLELQNRVGHFEEVQLVHGLIGEKDGEARIVDSPYHTMTSVIPGTKGKLTGYVDLDVLTRDLPVIDILKCDIEGAEELFIKRYPALLRRTQRAIVELHSFGSDEKRCIDLLRSYGLEWRETVMRRDWISLQYFSRGL
jgi:FkbM family methyltransferase